VAIWYAAKTEYLRVGLLPSRDFFYDLMIDQRNNLQVNTSYSSVPDNLLQDKGGNKENDNGFKTQSMQWRA
jgi:hypothetical protein